MDRAVAAFGESHKLSNIILAAVEFHGAGRVIGGAACHLVLGLCHLHSVKTCTRGLLPGKISLVCPTIYVDAEVGWLARDCEERKEVFVTQQALSLCRFFILFYLG